MTRRLSLILGDDEQREVEPYVQVGTGAHEVLLQWATLHGVGSIGSEAAVLRVLLRAGVEAMRDEVLDRGYAELAKTYHTPELDAERRAIRERHMVRRAEVVE